MCKHLLLARGRDRLETWYCCQYLVTKDLVSYSLGDAIDWKLDAIASARGSISLLLARGRDRLETTSLEGLR